MLFSVCVTLRMPGRTVTHHRNSTIMAHPCVGRAKRLVRCVLTSLCSTMHQLAAKVPNIQEVSYKLVPDKIINPPLTDGLYL
jgi:hypothetical protein